MTNDQGATGDPDDIIRLIKSERGVDREQGNNIIRKHYAGRAVPPEVSRVMVEQLGTPPWPDSQVTALVACLGPYPDDTMLRILLGGSASQKRAVIARLWNNPVPEHAAGDLRALLKDLAQGSNMLAFDAAHYAGSLGERWGWRRLAEIIVESDRTVTSHRHYAWEVLSKEALEIIENELCAMGAPTLSSTMTTAPTIPAKVDVCVRYPPSGGVRTLLELRSKFGAAIPLAELRSFKEGDPPLVIVADAEEPWARSIKSTLPSDLQDALEFRTPASRSGQREL